MILVLLGTQDKPFDRLVKEVIKQKENKTIKDKILIQKGCTKIDSPLVESFDFKTKEEIEDLIEKARVVITHAGVGTIIECLLKNKKVIVVPRLRKHLEHTNDHQMQITKEFETKGYVVPLYNINNLAKALDEIKVFKPVKYTSNENNFRNKIKEYIDNI